MDRLSWILVLFLSMACMHGHAFHSQALAWKPGEMEMTNLHFFVHENRGEPPTIATVAQDNATGFAVNVIDDILRTGPELDAEVIGDAKGMSVPPTSKTGPAVGVLVLDFGFTKGEFNGSSFSVFSRNLVSETERELAVVGGREKFRMATGFALLRSVFSNATYFIIEYNVTLFHYYKVDGRLFSLDDDLNKSY